MKCFTIMTLVLGALLATTPAALAADTNCNSTILSSVTIEGNLIVSDNATCMLQGGGTVSGNVSVGKNARLTLEYEWTIGGNLQAHNCAFVSLNPGALYSTVVGGNVQIENCSGKSWTLGYFPAGAAFGSFGPASMIGGNFLCDKNTGPCILVDNHVGGNVHVVNNTSSAPSQIDGNSIGNKLLCENNVPAPTGSGNTVVGNNNKSSEGQCKGF